MPASPTQAQSDASRRNGTLAAGPATPDGKARSARNAIRHNLHGPFRLLPHEDPAALDRLLAGLAARHEPADDVELHWVEEIAFAMWRQRRLRAIEIVGAAEPESTNEPEAPSLPSPATLARYRARIERDLRLAHAELEAAKSLRPPTADRDLRGPTAFKLRWLADRLDGNISTADDADGMNEPEAAGFATTAPVEAPMTFTRTLEPAPRLDRGEPDAPAPLNRQQRRRLEALTRRLAA